MVGAPPGSYIMSSPSSGSGSGFSFADLIGGAIDWARDNPGLAGGLLGGIGSLIDPAQAPTETRTQNVQLPEYIKPYVGRMLNQFESLSQEDYIPYSGPRIEGFNADQQEAFNRIRNMASTNPMQEQGAGIVGTAAEQLLANANKRWDGNEAAHYMSPYMQGVIDISKREAQRDFDTKLPNMQAAAARAGAFGGDRHAIMQAEAQRNLSQQLGDIQTRGLQDAYVNAQGQFNADMSRQGSNLTGAGNMGNTLAGIGQQAFQNQLANNTGLLNIGNQQQTLGQRSLDVGYQNFQDQRNHPYNQVRFMQQGLQGLPMTQTQTSQVGSAPTWIQQFLSAGIGGLQLGNAVGGNTTGGRP